MHLGEEQHIGIAGQLAKKGVQPRHIYLLSSGTGRPPKSLTALLSQHQHNLFGRLKTLQLVCPLSKGMLQVGKETPPLPPLCAWHHDISALPFEPPMR
jgi:hypothetical protein